MSKYKAFQIIEDREFEQLKAQTDKPFEWFPELEKMFKHFDIKEMKIKIDNEEISYIIRKEIVQYSCSLCKEFKNPCNCDKEVYENPY